MKKYVLLAAVLVAVGVGALYQYQSSLISKNVPPVIVAPSGSSDYKSASYTIDGKEVVLVNGVSEVEAAPGSASKITTRYFGNDLKKDLDGNDTDDVVFLLTQNTGGSGTFYYVVAALSTPHGYIGSKAMLLGDRIAPQTIESGPGKSIIVNYADRKVTDPMSAQPSVGKSVRLILDLQTMQFGEVAQNFEGEANPDVMSLTMKKWKWFRAEYNDGKVITPKRDVFTLTFDTKGSFSITTDCNGGGGKYVATKSTITLSDMMSTLMYCEGSQEADFQKLLSNSSSYLFTSKGELVLNLKMDSGSVYFK
ncbi:MAG: hypothetical protein RL094_365 [Candidatus Parcubacteria bacterium]|jgi:heat shock protein HslJ